MNAEIIIIGDEILIGQTTDTNSGWMASQLTEHHIRTEHISVIADRETEILSALTVASGRSELVLITGGLGPTADDVTKVALSNFFGSPLKSDAAVLQHVEQIFARSTRQMLPVNIKQAEVLECSTVLFNEAGTAPGMWIEYQGTIFVVMPGVPTEMMYLMEKEVLPRLREFPSQNVICNLHMLTAGIGESFLAEKLRSVEESLPDYIHLAYLPAFAQVKLRLSAEGVNKALLEEELDIYGQRMKSIIGEHVINDTNKLLEETLLDEMRERGLRLAVAESCSGGFLSHLLTRIPGSSDVFLGGVVAYSNDLKMKFLQVTEECLSRYGAVSERTALEMSEGIKRVSGSDYSIAITGIAGPGGGSEAKPIGGVWISISGQKGNFSRLFQFGKRRDDTIQRSARNALYHLLRIIREENPYIEK